MEMFTLQRATLIGLFIVSLVVTICSAVLMTKNHGKNTGFILLIVGAVIAGILALLGLVLELSHGFSAEYLSPSSESCRARATLKATLILAQLQNLRSLLIMIILLRLHLYRR